MRITMMMPRKKSPVTTPPLIAGSAVLDLLRGAPARPRICPLDVHYRDDARGFVFIDAGLDDLADPREGDLALEERHHRHLVGPVHHGGERESQTAHPVRQIDSGEGLAVDRLESESFLGERDRFDPG